jgi:hypothetical protein
MTRTTVGATGFDYQSGQILRIVFPIEVTALQGGVGLGGRTRDPLPALRVIPTAA